MKLYARKTFTASELSGKYPPIWQHPHKQRIFEICQAASKRIPPSLEIVVSRWRGDFPAELGEVDSIKTEILAQADFFDYREPESGRESVWYPNFAHSDLFCAYGSPLLAQDELQCLEHPALGSLREALLDLMGFEPGLAPATVENGVPTPVLITGVPRICDLKTGPSAEAPLGIYGNQFAGADWEVISSQLELLEPATLTNIIAIEAPTGGTGQYAAEEIRHILQTAFSGFRAAVEESRLSHRHSKIEIHTGFWGCGAYGGNRTLMTLLQAIAAHAAGVDRLIFHTGNAAGLATVEEAQSLLGEVLCEDPATMAQRILSLHFEWGISDGN